MSLRSLLQHIGIGAKPVPVGRFPALTDFHSHILPGVDDGVRTMDDSLAILARYEELGMRHVWLTPHIMEEVPNTTDSLRQRFEELRETYTGSVDLSLAAENMIDNLFVERLAAGDLLPIGDNGDRLLVETSYYSPPEGFDEILASIMDKGLRPVLAHPERYRYMVHDVYLRLKDMGVEFQLNILSLDGLYGLQARDTAIWLSGKRLYDYLGSDIHRPVQTDHIAHVLSSRTFKRCVTGSIPPHPGVT